jgi:hypothetical protein
MSLTKAKEKATSACRCRRVSVIVQRYSVQYKGYNLIGVTTVEGDATRGTTALVYWQLHSSLYTCAVQGYWSTHNWSDRRQGKQVSTYIYPYPYPYIYINIYTVHIYIYIYVYIYIRCPFKRKTEAQVIFHNPFTVCSPKFVLCPFVYKETKGSYPFANGLNGLAHLWCLVDI